MNINEIIQQKSFTFSNKGEDVNVEITDEFRIGLDLLENTQESLFITGKAGTGKSTLSNLFLAHTNKTAASLAFTGLAAINVGGATIHSFFKFPLGFLDYRKIKFNPNLVQKLKSVDVIVIDEISMVRADMIDAMDASLKKHREDNRPFGGVQMVFMGDLHQLPPIIDQQMGKIYHREYATPYFFSANVFLINSLKYLNLETIFRQKDPDFIEALNSVRERNRNLFTSLEKINENVIDTKKSIAKEMINGETVCITTTNKKSKTINDYFLSKLKTEDVYYDAFITGDFDEKSYPTDARLRLRVGAKVMIIRNDKDKRYVNGDIGIITHLEPTKIRVRIGKREIYIEQAEWEKYEYEVVNDEDADVKYEKKTITKKVVGEFRQFPLKLAWAITIHKSQGQTYNRVFIDFDNGTFTSGQAYVALSRCRSLDGMMLNKEIGVIDVKLDNEINTFYTMFKNIMDG